VERVEVDGLSVKGRVRHSNGELLQVEVNLQHVGGTAPSEKPSLLQNKGERRRAQGNRQCAKSVV